RAVCGFVLCPVIAAPSTPAGAHSSDAHTSVRAWNEESSLRFAAPLPAAPRRLFLPVSRLVGLFEDARRARASGPRSALSARDDFHRQPERSSIRQRFALLPADSARRRRTTQRRAFGDGRTAAAAVLRSPLIWLPA